MKVEMKVWVDPQTMKPADNPIEAVLTDSDSFRKLVESGLRYEITSGAETSGYEAYNYSGKCVLCGDLIRKDLELSFIPDKRKIGSYDNPRDVECDHGYTFGCKVCDKAYHQPVHRNCHELALMEGSL